MGGFENPVVHARELRCTVRHQLAYATQIAEVNRYIGELMDLMPALEAPALMRDLKAWSTWVNPKWLGRSSPMNLPASYFLVIDARYPNVVKSSLACLFQASADDSYCFGERLTPQNVSAKIQAFSRTWKQT